jgi:hypothetical protein
MGQKARVELVLDCAEPQRLASFWLHALDYRHYYSDATLTVLVPKEGIASPLLLQGVPEPKAGKNRMHLDIVADDIEGCRESELIGSTMAYRTLEELGG